MCVAHIVCERPFRNKHFEYIEVAVLPEDCDEAEIRALEKRLQIQKTHRAEYKWHTRAAMMKEEREDGAKDADLAKSYGLASKKDVDIIISALEYAELYYKKSESAISGVWLTVMNLLSPLW